MLTFEIYWTVLMVLCIVGLVISMVETCRNRRILLRNEDVLPFRTRLLNLTTVYNLKRITKGVFSHEDDALTWFFGKHTYEEMLYSKKPLTLEEWYTKEEIDRINS